MAEDPSKIAAKMKEGVNIPGPGVSIPVDSSRLPAGWEKRVIQRGIGVTKGKWDVFIVEEDGRKSFRSKTDLQKHIDEKKLPYNSDAFDFSLDDNLKKLRQIWKQYIVKPRLKPGERMSPSVPAKKGKKKNEGLTSPLSSSSQLSSLTSSALALQVQQNGQFASFKGPVGIVSSMLVDNTDLQKVLTLFMSRSFLCIIKTNGLGLCLNNIFHNYPFFLAAKCSRSIAVRWFKSRGYYQRRHIGTDDHTTKARARGGVNRYKTWRSFRNRTRFAVFYTFMWKTIS